MDSDIDSRYVIVFSMLVYIARDGNEGRYIETYL